jgi:hypothetical protein
MIKELAELLTSVLQFWQPEEVLEVRQDEAFRILNHTH